MKIGIDTTQTFKPAFAGFKWVFMYASGISGPNSDWQIRGSWTAP